MSYILDALRRAQSERERGQIPGLHAQTDRHREPLARRAAAPSLMVGMLIAGLLLAVAAALSMWWLQAPSIQPAALPKPMSRPAAPTPAPTPSTVGAAAKMADPSVAPALPIPLLGSTVGLPAPAAGPAAALPIVVSAPVTPVTPVKPVPGTGPSAAVGSPIAAAPAVAMPNKADAVVALTALSPELRRDWPALTLGGSVWSDSPASRFVILNGAVLRQGDEVVPGVVLEQILPKAARLRWRGMLVEIGL